MSSGNQIDIWPTRSPFFQVSYGDKSTALKRLPQGRKDQILLETQPFNSGKKQCSRLIGKDHTLTESRFEFHSSRNQSSFVAQPKSKSNDIRHARNHRTVHPDLSSIQRFPPRVGSTLHSKRLDGLGETKRQMTSLGQHRKTAGFSVLDFLFIKSSQNSKPSQILSFHFENHSFRFKIDR